MDFTLQHVEIDGVSVPANQAADGVRAALDGADIITGVIHGALAQPIGAALEGSKAACDAVKKRCLQFVRKVDKAAANIQDGIIQALGGYVGSVLQQTGDIVSTVGQVAATGRQQSVHMPPSPVAQGPPGIDMPPGGTGGGGNPFPWHVWYHCSYRDQYGVTHPPAAHMAAGPPLGPPYLDTPAFGPASYAACQAWVVSEWPKFRDAACTPHDTGPIQLPLPPGQSVPAPPDQRLPGGAFDNCPPRTHTWTDRNGLPSGQYPGCYFWVVTYDCINGGWGVQEIHIGGGQVGYPGDGVWLADSTIAVPPNQPDFASLWAALAWGEERGGTFKALCGGAPPPTPGPIPKPLPPPVPAPQPPPPSPPPSPGEPPPSACLPIPANPCAPPPDKIDCGGVSVPDMLTVGSVAFCQSKAELRRAFVAAGELIIKVALNINVDDLSSIGDNSSIWDSITSPTKLLAQGVVRVVVSWLSDSTKSKVGALVNTIKCWYHALRDAKSCNMSEVAALAVFRAAVEFLQRFRLGWDLAVWGTVDITVHIDPLVKVLDYLINDACPAEIPDAGGIIDAWLHLTIDEDQAKCLLSLRGYAWDVILPEIRARRERVTPEKLVNISRRLGLSDDDIASELRYWGYLDKTDAQDFITAYDQLPTVSDVLHFLQRNVFNDDYVRDYGLMDGYEERFAPRYLAVLRAQGIQEKTARDHYAAHWINPSVGQLAEMAQRLRTGRVDASVQFQWQDFLRVLAEQDVAPYFRERLRAISYRTLPIRQLTQLVLSRQIDEAELGQRWQDIGYKPADATILARSMMFTAARQRATQQHGYTPAVVAKLWPAGQITRQQAYDALAPQGMTQADVDTLLEVADKSLLASQYEKHSIKTIADYAALATKAYGDGVVSREDAARALQAAGYTEQATALELQTIELTVRMQKIDAAVKAIRRSFLRGELSQDQALNALQIAGVLDYAALDRVQRWQLEMTVPRKSAATAQIIKWAKEGIISVVNAEARLLNLGWQAVDIVLMIAELNQTIRQAQALAAQRRAKELAKAQAAVDRAQKQIYKQYCSTYTRGKMTLWYAEHVIDEDTFRSRLKQCGHGPEAIDLLFKEAEVARAKRDRQAEKNGPVGIEYTGPGSDSG